MSGLLLGIVLSVCTCWFHNIVTLPPWLVSTDFGTCSYQCFCPFVPLFPCICWSVVVHTLYYVFLCTLLLPLLGMLILCGLLSHKIVRKVYYYYYYCNLVNDRGNLVRTVRSCGWERHPRISCHEYVDEDREERICQCFEDGCSFKAPHVLQPSVFAPDFCFVLPATLHRR